MENGHLLLALIAIPLLTAVALVLVPSAQKDLIRKISVLSGLAMFLISLYVFFDYQSNDSEQFIYQLRYEWLENVGFLG